MIETLFFKENHIIRLVFGIISIICLFGLFLFFQSFVMIIVPVLIGLEIYNETKHQKIRDYLRQEKINYHTDYENLPDKDYWLIRDCLIMSFPKKYIGVVPGHYEYTIAEPLLVQHISAVLQINLKFDLNIFKRIIMMWFSMYRLLGPLLIVGVLLHLHTAYRRQRQMCIRDRFYIFMFVGPLVLVGLHL